MVLDSLQKRANGQIMQAKLSSLCTNTTNSQFFFITIDSEVALAHNKSNISCSLMCSNIVLQSVKLTMYEKVEKEHHPLQGLACRTEPNKFGTRNYPLLDQL